MARFSEWKAESTLPLSHMLHAEPFDTFSIRTPAQCPVISNLHLSSLPARSTTSPRPRLIHCSIPAPSTELAQVPNWNKWRWAVHPPSSITTLADGSKASVRTSSRSWGSQTATRISALLPLSPFFLPLPSPPPAGSSRWKLRKRNTKLSSCWPEGHNVLALSTFTEE